MVFKHCHDFVLIEIGNPVEQGEQESFWVAVECLTDTVNGDMIVHELYLVSISFERIDHVLFLPPRIIGSLPMELVHVARVKKQVMDVREREIHNCSSSVGRWDLLDDLELLVSVIMLREVYQKSWPSVVHCDVDSWELIQASVMVADCHQDWHHVAEGGRDFTVHSQEGVPSVGASGHVIIIGDVPTHEKDIWVERGNDFAQVDCSLSVPRITCIDHSDGDRRVRRQCLVNSVRPVLIVVEDLSQILCVRLESVDKGRVHHPGCLPFESIVFEGVGSDIFEFCYIRAVEFPIKYCQFGYINVGVDVQEKCLFGILRDRGVDLAWRPWWT